MIEASRAVQDCNTVEVFELVHARLLCFFPHLVKELGGDPQYLMKCTGIHAGEPAAGKSGATYRQLAQLVELAATELRCPDFGMRLAKLQSGSNMFGPLGRVMKHSRTFGDALQYARQHTYAHSLAARVWLKRSHTDKTIFAGHDLLLERLPNRTQAMEQIMLAGHLVAMEITGNRARARKVHFRHQPVSALKIYRRYFGCEVRFGQNEDGVVFSERDLACPIVDPDAGAYERATSYIDEKFTQHTPPIDAQARGVIMQLLGTDHCTNERIAAELQLHPKKMHRLLKAHGTSFQKIKDEVRRDFLLYYVRDTHLDFRRISESLGFAEQSVMTRYCNRWFSASPTNLRTKGNGLAAAS